MQNNSHGPGNELASVLDQEIAEWATIVSLIGHHQTKI